MTWLCMTDHCLVVFTFAPQGSNPKLNSTCGFPEHVSSPSCCFSCFYFLHVSKHLKKGPNLWIPLPTGMIVAENWACSLGGSGHPWPMALMRKRNHLLPLVNGFPLWNSTCTLIKPSLMGKTHSTQKNQYTPLCHFFSVLEYLFWLTVSLRYEAKWWGILCCAPLGGIIFISQKNTYIL